MFSSFASLFKTKPKHITQLDPEKCKIVAQTRMLGCVECKDGSKWAAWFGGHNTYAKDGDLIPWDNRFEQLFNDPKFVTWKQGQAGPRPPFNKL